MSTLACGFRRQKFMYSLSLVLQFPEFCCNKHYYLSAPLTSWCYTLGSSVFITSEMWMRFCVTTAYKCIENVIMLAHCIWMFIKCTLWMNIYHGTNLQEPVWRGWFKWREGLDMWGKHIFLYHLFLTTATVSWWDLLDSLKCSGIQKQSVRATAHSIHSRILNS